MSVLDSKIIAAKCLEDGIEYASHIHLEYADAVISQKSTLTAFRVGDVITAVYAVTAAAGQVLRAGLGSAAGCVKVNSTPFTLDESTEITFTVKVKKPDFVAATDNPLTRAMAGCGTVVDINGMRSSNVFTVNGSGRIVSNGQICTRALGGLGSYVYNQVRFNTSDRPYNNDFDPIIGSVVTPTDIWDRIGTDGTPYTYDGEWARIAGMSVREYGIKAADTLEGDLYIACARGIVCPVSDVCIHVPTDGVLDLRAVDMGGSKRFITKTATDLTVYSLSGETLFSSHGWYKHLCVSRHYILANTDHSGILLDQDLNPLDFNSVSELMSTSDSVEGMGGGSYYRFNEDGGIGVRYDFADGTTTALSTGGVSGCTDGRTVVSAVGENIRIVDVRANTDVTIPVGVGAIKRFAMTKKGVLVEGQRGAVRIEPSKYAVYNTEGKIVTQGRNFVVTIDMEVV